jgi:hypothetical protein
LGTSIISLAKHWCNIKVENYVDNLQIILPTNVDQLSVQIQKQNQNQMHPEEGDLFGRGLELIIIPNPHD